MRSAENHSWHPRSRLVRAAGSSHNVRAPDKYGLIHRLPDGRKEDYALPIHQREVSAP
jgi:hypothetical protein